MTLDELKKALDTDLEKAAAFKESLAGMTPESDDNEAEALSKAAAAVGFEISPEQIERDLAAAMELDDSELEAVGGGDDDDDGHDSWCFTIWHCFATSMHTSDGEGYAACWSDWRCFDSYHVLNKCSNIDKKEKNCWTAWEWRGCNFITK